jgi:hypothetical protein
MARLNTGQTYTGQHLPNGVEIANCAGCSSGRWTCKGNQIFKSVNGMSYTGVLSPDGNTITDPFGTLSRVGAEAEDYMRQARAADQYCTYADQTQAWRQYLKAAEEFEAVGNASRAAQAKKLAAAANAKSYQCVVHRGRVHFPFFRE